MIVQILGYAFIAYVLYLIIKTIRIRLQYDLHKIPSPPSLPYIGHLHHFMKFEKAKFSKWINEWYYKLGEPKVILRKVPGENILYVLDENYLQDRVLGHNGFRKDGSNTRRFGKFFTKRKRGMESLFSSPTMTPYWKAVRRAVQYSFSSDGIKQKFPAILECIKRVDSYISANKEHFDGQDTFTLYAFDVIMTGGFKIDYDVYKSGLKIIRALMETISYSFLELKNPLNTYYMLFFPNSKLAQNIKKNMQITFSIVNETNKIILSRDLAQEEDLTLTACLRRVVDPETNETISDEKLFAETRTLIFGGLNTTGQQLAWVFTILSYYPEAVDKILDELKQNNLSGPDAKELEYPDLSKLKYLNAVLKETMRKVSSTPVATMRTMDVDDVVCGYRVPKGTKILVDTKLLHSMDCYWDKAHEFIPERWLEENTQNSKRLYTFSHGPRNCVGQRLAIAEIMALIVVLLPKYKIMFKKNGRSLEQVMSETHDNITTTHDEGLFFECTERT